MIFVSRLAVGPVFAGVLATLSSAAWGQTPPPATSQATPVVSSATQDAGVLGELLKQYYEAYAREDIAAMEQAWHPQGPARSSRNVFVMLFELRDTSLASLIVRDPVIEPGGGRARAVVELAILDRKTKRESRERVVRDFTFLQDAQGQWKIWNEASAAGRLAARLRNVPPEGREALFAAEPELLSDDTLTGLGIEVMQARTHFRLDEALRLLDLTVQLARRLDRGQVLGRALIDAALILQVAGKLPEAERQLVDARQSLAANGTAEDLAVCDTNLGNVRYARGHYDAARADLERALAYYEEARDQPRIASVLHALSNARYMQGDFEGALGGYDRALGILSVTGDRYGAASLHRAVALVHKELGNYGTAIEAFGKATSLSREVNDPVGTAQAHHGAGEVYRLVGDFGQALRQFSAALDQWAKTPDVVNKAGTQFSIGQVCAQQRQFTRAVEWYEKALASDESAREEPGIARDLGGLGGAHFALGQQTQALDEYRRSLQLREKLDDRPGVVWTLIHMGVVLQALKQPVEAIGAYDRAVQLAQGLGDRAAIATAFALRGAVQVTADDPSGALESETRSVELAAALPRYDVLAFAHLVSGRAHRALKKDDEARTSFLAAVEAVERVPVGPGAETFFDDRRSHYLAMADLEADQGRPVEALAWVERGRLRALSVMLGGDGSFITKGMSTSEIDEERRLSREIRKASVRVARERLREAPVPGQLESLIAALDALVAERQRFRTTLFAAHPDLIWQRAQEPPPGLERLAGLVGDDHTAVAVFAVLEARTRLFILRRPSADTPPSVQSVSFDVASSDLASQIAAFRNALVARKDEASKLGAELYTTLLAPASQPLNGITHLIVVPDWSLWALPFEALRKPSGRLVIEDSAVAYAPSLTWLLRRPTDQAAGPGRLVAVSAPVLSAEAQQRLALMAPSASALPKAGTPAPSTSRTIRSLSLLFTPTRRQVLTGAQASEPLLRAAKFEQAAVHLDVPLVLSDSSPLFSAWAFTPAPGAASPDGVVETSDLFEWTLPASLLALPRADAGGQGSGDALMVAAWAAVIAGTPTVVASRWTTDDRAGGWWNGFYTAWATPTTGGKRRDAASALQRGVRGLLAQPGTHPMDAAGIMVLGGAR